MSDPIAHKLNAYFDAPVGRTILGRAVFDENRLGRIVRSVCGGVGFVLKTGGILAIGGGLMWVGALSGQETGREAGFREGCRAVADGALCDHMDELGASINRLRIHDPGKALPPENESRIAEMCRVMLASLPRGLAQHYGCDGS